MYGIVRRHEGSIEIDSAPGRGTTVSISLPLYKEPATPGAAGAAGGGGKAVAHPVVEDEPLVRQVIEAYLCEDKHTVQSAVNGREGLEKYREGTFDVVLTDRAMPEVSGDRACGGDQED